MVTVTVCGLSLAAPLAPDDPRQRVSRGQAGQPRPRGPRVRGHVLQPLHLGPDDDGEAGRGLHAPRLVLRAAGEGPRVPRRHGEQGQRARLLVNFSS